MSPRTSATFQRTGMTRLAVNGNAVQAAISPDGKYVAYALQEGGQQGLWMRQVTVSSSIRINPPAEVQYRGLEFSRDGSSLYYAMQEKNSLNHGTLYQVPVLGGHQKKVIEDIQSAAALSPDSRRIAFVRQNVTQASDDLMVANADGGGERTIASRKHPLHFAWSSSPAWSPDGKQIAAAIEGSDAQGYFVNLVAFQVKDATHKTLTPKRWRFVERMAWLASGDAMLVIGQEPEARFQQVWTVSPGSGKARKISNDLSDYLGLSLTADSRMLVSVQFQTLANIWVGAGAQPESARANHARRQPVLRSRLDPRRPFAVCVGWQRYGGPVDPQCGWIERAPAYGGSAPQLRPRPVRPTASSSCSTPIVPATGISGGWMRRAARPKR